MATRIYLPATLAQVRAAQPGEQVPTLLGHAVTGQLRTETAGEDYQDEELEYLAQLAAAAESLEFIAADPQAPQLRVVLSADVPDDVLGARSAAGSQQEGLAASAVELTQPVAWSKVVCAHVDEVASAGLVAQVLAGADAALEELFEQDLLWWDATEFGVIPG